mgnify:FL=1
MNFEPGQEHAWLDQLVGDWSYTASAPQCGAMPPGRETVRSVGGFWNVGEGSGTAPDGTPVTSLITLGYDTRLTSFVGSWVGSMMPYMFVYEGTLDRTANTLTLDCQGPDFSDPTKSASYREVVTVLDGTTRTFVSYMEAADGTWTEIMNARYQRV